MNGKDVLEKLDRKFGTMPLNGKNGLWIKVDSGNLLDLCNYVKGMGFDHLSAISVTDFMERGEYELVYFVWSYRYKIALNIKAGIKRERSAINSVAGVWDEAQIHERELHELFGVEFIGNPDLSELFLENWKQIPPFRKDFDLRGCARKKLHKKDGKAYFEVEP